MPPWIQETRHCGTVYIDLPLGLSVDPRASIARQLADLQWKDHLYGNEKQMDETGSNVPIWINNFAKRTLCTLWWMQCGHATFVKEICPVLQKKRNKLQNLATMNNIPISSCEMKTSNQDGKFSQVQSLLANTNSFRLFHQYRLTSVESEMNLC